MFISMNLTFPVANRFMDASDLKRGLLAHVFSGYDESHINLELRQTIAKLTLKQPALTQQPA